MSDLGSEPVTGAGPDVGAAEAEEAELERLRAEVAELRSRSASSARRHRLGWRLPVATLLIVIGCLLAPISVLAVWSANQVSDTSRYVANIEPLIHEPAIQNALADKVTFQITSHLNVAGLTNQAAGLLTSKGLTRVGALLKTFSPAIASSVDGFIHKQVLKIVTSARFERAWLQVNTVAHEQLVGALSGTSKSVTVSNGKVYIDLAPFIAIVKQDLVRRGLTILNSLPPIHPALALFSSRDLVQAQTGYRLINDLKIVLPILSILLIGIGVYVARGHRRALVAAGLGFAASMLVLGAVLAIARATYLNTVPASVLPSDAAAAMFDTLVRFIKDALRLLLVVGLIVALGAFFTGPSVTAVQTRRAFRSGLGWMREGSEHAGLRTGPVGSFTYAHRKALRITAVALAALLFVFWGLPTVLVAIVITVVLLVVLGLIELIGRAFRGSGHRRPGLTAPAAQLRLSASPATDGSMAWHPGHAGEVDPRERLQAAGLRLTDPAESVAQRIAERALDLIVQALDVNQLVQRVDLNALLEKVDVNRILARVDMNAILGQIDVNAVIGQLDVNALVGRVDVDALLQQVNVNALLARADVDGLVQRVDVGALVDRVDVNELVRRVDMDALVQDTDLGAVIAKSSGGVASEALDAARSQAVGLDQFIDRWVGRAIRRRQPGPVAPAAQLDGMAESVDGQADS